MLDTDLPRVAPENMAFTAADAPRDEAFGVPGIEPRWTNGAKEGVGTAYAASCRVWFTLWQGIVTEVYYPTIDLPQIRDFQLLLTDGESFFHEEKRDLVPVHERMEDSLGYRIRSSAPDALYRLEKEVITDPHLPCVLVRYRLEGQSEVLDRLKIYALCAPHLNARGGTNEARVREVSGRRVIVAWNEATEIEDDDTWLAFSSHEGLGACSVGYAGRSDGWTDLKQDFRLDWQFDKAGPGNLALTGEVTAPLENERREFTLALAFGDNQHSAVTTLFQSLGVPFDEHKKKFLEQWKRPQRHRLDLSAQSCDGGQLYRTSFNVLLAHEDKRYPGALIASLSLPWGEAKTDTEMGGYHLVWPRDMVHSATALLAAGQTETAFRALIYLAASQNQDGSFAQNFWLDGRPYWQSLQLDEVAFPILLARSLERYGARSGSRGAGQDDAEHDTAGCATALRNFDPMALVGRAARFLCLHGPVSPQERWEEASGLSPSTLAAMIAGLICAAAMFRERNDEISARFLEEYADWLESNLDRWCATDSGSVVENEPRHYVRVFPLEVGATLPTAPPGNEEFDLTSRPPGHRKTFAAREVVDGGFLELVRYGIRAANDPLVRASVRVIDEVLRVETSRGVAFRRYNGDGYGQQENGDAYSSHGVGRAWPLLGGERGHYELALALSGGAGDLMPYLKSLESFASETGMLPEQVWDADDIPEKHLFCGHATGSARPLAWAHSEYIKLLRSRRDDVVFDRVPEAFARYVENTASSRDDLLVWGHNFPSEQIERRQTLRLIADEAFRVRWTGDDWKSHTDIESSATSLGIHFCDISFGEATCGEATRLEWTFFYHQKPRWEGRNYVLRVT